MKDLTVSIDEETYRLACDIAARQGKSVSALVRDYLAALAQGETTGSEFGRLRRLQDETLAAIAARGGGLRAADNLSRGDLHRRDKPARLNGLETPQPGNQDSRD